MSKPKRVIESEYGAPPATLDGHPFYGFELDDPEQIAFRDALWDPAVRFLAVDACSGSGKPHSVWRSHVCSITMVAWMA